MYIYIVFSNVFSANAGDVAIGLNDIGREGTYVWLDGSPVVYSDWGDMDPNGQPGNGDMVRMVRNSNYRWMDAGTEEKYSFMCASDTCPPGQSKLYISSQICFEY